MRCRDNLQDGTAVAVGVVTCWKRNEKESKMVNWSQEQREKKMNYLPGISASSSEVFALATLAVGVPLLLPFSCCLTTSAVGPAAAYCVDITKRRSLSA